MSTIMFMSDLSSLKDERALRQAELYIPEYRRNKIKSFRFSEDKNLSLLSWILLKYSLSTFGCKNFEEKIAFGVYGKPFLKGTSNIHFNVSHSHTAAFCVVSNAEIGCDIEYPSYIEWKEIAKAHFNQFEYDYLIKKGNAEDFFKIWTLKESFTKLLGYGLYIPLNSFSIQLNHKSISVDYSVDKKDYYFYHCKNASGYHFACSSLNTFDDESIHSIDVHDLLRNVY